LWLEFWGRRADPEGLLGCGVGREIPPPTGKRVWAGGYPLPPKNEFLLEMACMGAF